MQGEKQIIAARKQGYKPSAIFFRAGFEIPRFTSRFEKPENAIATKQYPEVWIGPQELCTRLDLRFAVGCRSLVHGKVWSDDLLGFIERLVQVDPLQVVVSAEENGDLMVWEHGNWKAYANLG